MPWRHYAGFWDWFSDTLTRPASVTVSAAGGILSPLWLPNLNQAHDFAALILPILGCTLALLQIGLLLAKIVFKGK